MKSQIKNNVDDQLDKNTVPRFNQTLENNLKVFVGNDIFIILLNMIKHKLMT